jgi:hypothetical protein
MVLSAGNISALFAPTFFFVGATIIRIPGDRALIPVRDLNRSIAKRGTP